MDTSIIKLPNPGSLILNGRHVFLIDCIEVPEVDEFEAKIPPVKLLLDIHQSLILRGKASVEFKEGSSHEFVLYAEDHKFIFSGVIKLSEREFIHIRCSLPIKAIY